MRQAARNGKENGHDKALTQIRGRRARVNARHSFRLSQVLVTIEQNGFGFGPIKVVSEDGKKWSKILDGDLTLPSRSISHQQRRMVSYKVKQPMATILETGELIHRRSLAGQHHGHGFDQELRPRIISPSSMPATPA